MLTYSCFWYKTPKATHFSFSCAPCMGSRIRAAFGPRARFESCDTGQFIKPFSIIIFLTCNMEKMLLPKVIVNVWWDSAPAALAAGHASSQELPAPFPPPSCPRWTCCSRMGLDKPWMCLDATKLPQVRRADAASECHWCSVLSS